MGALAIPLAVAAFGAVNQNVQNKSAIKNNENQQNASLANSKSAWNGAQTNFNNWLQQNPMPSQSMQQPSAGGNNATRQIMGAPTPSVKPQAVMAAPGTPQTAPQQQNPAQNLMATNSVLSTILGTA